MFLMDGALGKNAELCFTVMVCPKKCGTMFLVNGASDEKSGTLFFCIFKNDKNTCFLHFSILILRNYVFGSLGPLKESRNYVSGQWCPQTNCGSMFLVNGAAEKNAELCF